MASNQKEVGASRRHDQSSVRPAFTLVELLVVIGIIALLVSVLLPVLGKARESANVVKCQSNLRQMGQALQLYCGANRGMMPIGFVYDGEAMPTGSPNIYKGEFVDWTTLLIGALRSRKDLATSGWDSQPNVSTGNEGPRRMFLCPTNSIEAQVDSMKLNYSAHPRLLPDLGGADNLATQAAATGKNLPLTTRKIASVKRSAEIAIIFDGVIDPVISGQSGTNNSWNSTLIAFGLDQQGINSKTYMTDRYDLPSAAGYNASQTVNITPYTSGPLNVDSHENAGNIRFRHNKNTSANCLMLDGHVQAFLWNPIKKQTELRRRNINVNP